MIAIDAVPSAVFRTVAAAIPAQVRRPRHRDDWSPAERRAEHLLPAPLGRRRNNATAMERGSND